MPTRRATKNRRPTHCAELLARADARRARRIAASNNPIQDAAGRRPARGYSLRSGEWTSQ